MADFQQYYGLDLELLWDRAEFRRIRVLASQLPTQSRTIVKLNPQAAWDEHAYLLALVADNLSFMRYEQTGGKGRKPKPLERPKPKKQVKQHLDVSEGRVQNLLFAPRK